jgi:hypothetical protein
MKKLSTYLNRLFSSPERDLTVSELFTYPQETLGFKLASFLYDNSVDTHPVPEKEDIYRLLLTRETSNKEEIAMYYYLFGNGDNSLRTVFILATGAVFFPHYIKYFYSKYRDGHNAYRFYDLDHFRMLHLPVKQIKDAFRIR